MRFPILIVLCLTFMPLSRSWADTVSFAFGEQLGGQGSAVEGNLTVAGPVLVVPWIALNGSKFELLPMIQVRTSSGAIAIGPLVGSTNDPASGATAYFGGELRGKAKLWHCTLLVRLAERHTRQALLHRFANIGIEAGGRALTLRTSYQPIERNGVWTHRLALKATTAYRSVKIGLEVRQNLDGTAKKTALADVTIPLK